METVKGLLVPRSVYLSDHKRVLFVPMASGHVIDSLGFPLRVYQEGFLVQTVDLCLPACLPTLSPGHPEGRVGRRVDFKPWFFEFSRSSKTVGGVMYLKSCAEGIQLSQSEVTPCLSDH